MMGENGVYLDDLKNKISEMFLLSFFGKILSYWYEKIFCILLMCFKNRIIIVKFEKIMFVVLNICVFGNGLFNLCKYNFDYC